MQSQGYEVLLKEFEFDKNVSHVKKTTWEPSSILFLFTETLKCNLKIQDLLYW